ncbi:DUF4147 domain-containing protein [Halocatena marina]|uniref:DUF4147 domain-containing protein n=1 Tax=Halocatena marina TaxID=2934937 RepID=A0ABD5YUP5_9EURY|nr:DUF4147 domain-containing protein [Halocatena marina]
MTHAPESILGKSLTERHVVGKQPVDTKAVQSTVGDHPSRRNATPKRTATVLDILDEADEDTLVLFVLTGGASALLSASASTLTLNDLPATTDCLLDGGVPIDEINAGKHLSELKGGQLARRAAPTTVVGLLLERRDRQRPVDCRKRSVGTRRNDLPGSSIGVRTI